MVRGLIRVLSLAVPKHRRADWREEWEAELACWGTGGGRDSGPLPWRRGSLIFQAFAALPDAFHLLAHEWLLDILFLDLRHRVRSLAKSPAFTLVAILTIAVCIAANSAIFSVVNGIVFRPLPYPESKRIVMIFNSYPEAREDRAGNSIPDYFDRREQIAAFEEVGLFTRSGGIVGQGEAQQHVFRLNVTPSLFRVLGGRPHLGRLLQEEDGEIGNHLRVVISHGLWQTMFGGSQSVVGQSLPFDGVAHMVVGVLPEDFSFPTWDAGVWMPLAYGPEERADDNRYSGGPEMLALLTAGATVETAQEQVDALNAATLERYPAEIQNLVREAGFRTVIRTFHDDLIRHVRLPLLLLWGGVLFVLLIGCVNIANLLLVRTSSRSREFAAQHALGAPRFRILRQIVTESIFLSVAGGGLGLLAGTWSMRFLETFAVYEVPRMAEVRMDLAAMGFTFLLVLGVGLVAGVVPAVRLLRGDLTATFLSGARTSTAGRRTTTLQGVLVSSQVAVTFVLMMGAGLLFASMRNVLAVDPGFEPEGVLGTALSLPIERFPDGPTRIQFMDAALEEMRRIPTVEDAAVVSNLPFSGVVNTRVVTPEGFTREADEPVFTSEVTYVSPGYFDVMGIPLRSGRHFGPSDTMEEERVVLIDEWLADRYWPSGDALGRRIALTSMPDEDTIWFRIVGVVGSLRQNDLTDQRQTGAVYQAHSQVRISFFRLAVKTRGDPLGQMPAVRAAIQRVDPGLTPYWVVSLAETMEDSLIPRRTPMQMLVASAAVALLLATLGIYGVLAYSVSQRTREIGIRVALGGTSNQIVRLVGRQWLGVVGMGLVVGFGGALILSRLIASLLYQVAPTDPAVLAGALLLLGSVALVAYLLPAWRATRVDPVRVLNAE
jgi:predicted permease